MEKDVHIDKSLCNGCETCVLMFPRQILFVNEEGVCDVTDHSRCDRLRGCEFACPEGAIKVV